MQLPNDLLRTFMSVVDTQSFTRAGQAVNLTQSAVSQQLKRLEQELGQELFARNGREVALTPAGEALLPYARRMLLLHDEAVSALSRPEMVGLVRLGSPDDYAARFLPSILARFAQAFPRVQVYVRCEPSSRLHHLLAESALDLIVVTA
jgi:DNA-binding transcriptional LysR family regulator